MSEVGIIKGLSRSGFALILLALIATTLINISSSASSSPTTRFVSTIGSDAAAGTQQAPFLTIGAAITAASAGDTIEISAGTFVAPFTIDKGLTMRCANAGISAGAIPGTRGTETIIEGEVTVTAAEVVIDGCHFVRPAASDRLSVTPKLISSNVNGEVTVQNSKLDGTKDNLDACGSGTSGTAQWRLYNNEFKNTRYNSSSAVCTNLYESRAVFADLGRRIVVSGNRFINTGQSIYITGPLTGPVAANGSEIRGNLFEEGVAQGVFMGTPQNVIIKGNTFAGAGGVYLASSVNTVIENNLFKASNRWAFWAAETTSGTILRNNAILGAYPDGVGADFAGKTVFNYSPNDVTAISNWWGDDRSATNLIGGSQSARVTFNPTLSFDGAVNLDAIGFFPSGSSGDGNSELTASHTATFTVATTRSISLERIPDGETPTPGSGTTVAFGGVPQTGERQITQVRINFTADDAINVNSRVKITAQIDNNTATGVTLEVGAANISSNGAYIAVPTSRFSLSTSAQAAITSIYGGASGVTNATSDLTYRLVTSNASTATSQTKTVTYTLGDE